MILSLLILAQMLGPQKILVLQYAQSGYQSSSPATVANEMQTANASIDEFSYGKASLTWAHYAFTTSGSPCQGEVDRIAVADPYVDFGAGWTRFLFNLSGSGCNLGVSITGDVGYDTDEGMIVISAASFERTFKWEVALHELIHTYGLPEGNRVLCTNFPDGFPIACGSEGYGDHSSIMGQYLEGHPSPWMKESLGWFDSTQVTELVGAPGSEYHIPRPAPYEIRSGYKVVKIRRGYADYFRIIRRTPTGFDSGIDPIYFDGLQVYANTYFVRMLRDGEIMVDQQTGTYFSYENEILHVILGDPDIVPPTGGQPAPNDTVFGMADVIVEADDDRGMYMVDVFSGQGRGAWEAQDTTEPFVMAFNTENFPDGPYTLLAEIWDLGGNMTRLENNTFTIANGTLPDSSLSDFPRPMIICPLGELPYVVTLRDTNGHPMRDEVVTVFLGEIVCPGYGSLINGSIVATATTSDSGQAVFNIPGGRCGEKAWFQVRGQWVAKNVMIHSPDVLGDGEVDLEDGVYFTWPLRTGIWDWCTDFNEDGKSGLDDAVAITPHISEGHACQ